MRVKMMAKVFSLPDIFSPNNFVFFITERAAQWAALSVGYSICEN